jgi:hypothetical protein
MKKFFALALAAVLTLGAMSASADVRDMGIGIRADQENGIDNVFDWPHLINNYSVVDYRLDFYGSSDNWGGVVRKDDYIGHWGLYLGRPVQNNFSTGWDFVNAQFNGILDGNDSWDDLLFDDPSNDTADSGFASSPTADFDSVGFPGPGTEILTPERKFDLLKAFKAGNGVFGVRIEYGNNKNTDASGSYSDPDLAGAATTSADVVQKSGFLGFQLGYGMEDAGPFKHVDLGLGYTMGSVDNSYNRETLNGFNEYHRTIEGDGISSIRFKARATKETSENNTWVFNGGVRLDKLAVSMDRTWDQDGDGNFTDQGETIHVESEYKNTNIALGVNMNQMVHDGKGLAIVGLSLLSDKMSRAQDDRYNFQGSAAADRFNSEEAGDEWEQSYFGVYANVGVEASLFSWMQFRGGIAKELFGSTKIKVTETSDSQVGDVSLEDSTTAEDSWDTWDGVTATFGVGLAFKNWQVDLLTSSGNIEEFLMSPAPGDGVAYGNNGSQGAILDFFAVNLKYML